MLPGALRFEFFAHTYCFAIARKKKKVKQYTVKYRPHMTTSCVNKWEAFKMTYLPKVNCFSNQTVQYLAVACPVDLGRYSQQMAMLRGMSHQKKIRSIMCKKSPYRWWKNPSYPNISQRCERHISVTSQNFSHDILILLVTGVFVIYLRSMYPLVI